MDFLQTVKVFSGNFEASCHFECQYYIINKEIFAELNFCGFCGFKSTASFSVNT